MLRYTCFSLLLVFATSLVNMQNLASQNSAAPLPIDNQREAVIEPINKLFRAMLEADSSGLAACFHPSAKLNTVGYDDNGTAILEETVVKDFLALLSKAPKGILKEVLHYTEVRIDGDLATAWTPYTFYLRGEISHCGANAFQLARTGTNGSWQIINITDSRQKENCPTEDLTDPVSQIDSFATQWHRAAAQADASIFFDNMNEGAIYIGTDAGEHWDKASFMSFAKPYFDKGKAWSFKATERHIFHYPDENIAYWDELLDTWMGPCRGTGIVKRQFDGSWKLLHYTLSVTVDNDLIQDFIKLSKKKE